MLITDVRYFKPRVITAIFRANDIIKEHEEVTKLGLLQSGESKDSNYYSFAVQYKDFRTQRHAPDHLYLKISHKGSTHAKNEVDFYTRILLPMTRRIDRKLLHIPTCYDCYYDEISDQSHLVLQDFTKEYSPSKNNIPLTAKHHEHILDSLAILHAYWWEHPLLEEFSPRISAERLNNLTEGYQSKISAIKKSVGQYLDSKYLAILEKIASGILAKHKERLISGKSLTVIHNNLIPENLVYSLHESYIINWQNWTVGIHSDDLARMILLYREENPGKFQEQQLLKRYFDTLAQRGVANYSWADLEYDYKASLARIIGDLLLAWTMDKHTRGHWRVMETAIDSFIKMDGASIYSE